MFDIHIITAPRPDGVDYLQATLNDIALHFDVEPVVFYEPGVKINYPHFIRHSTTLGVVENWFYSVSYWLNNGLDEPFLLACEDDILFKTNLEKYPTSYVLRRAMQTGAITLFGDEILPMDKIAFISPYCSKNNSIEEYNKHHVWARAYMPRWGWAGALCLLLTRHFAEWIVSNRDRFIFYAQERTQDGVPRHLDYAIGRCAQEAGLEIITHMPSLILHTGDTSTREGNNTVKGRANAARQAAE